jgi:hypothetical protein
MPSPDTYGINNENQQQRQPKQVNQLAGPSNMPKVITGESKQKLWPHPFSKKLLTTK